MPLTSDLLSIKLHRPSPPARRVQRPDINRLLDEGLEMGRPLALVSAPAGYGKTTCISEWLDGVAYPAAWLCLNTEENEPGRFFSYLIAALAQAADPPGPESFSRLNEVAAVLRSGQLPPAEVIATAWLADILDYPGRFLLVLDDFHLIQDRFIFSVFEQLISHLFRSSGPQPMHLVLLTREDPPLPLARLRANNRLTEIRLQELRFSSDETGHFLNEVMGLALNEKDITLLDERMEGWVAGLQLAGLSVRGRADPAGFIYSLRGSQRFILSYLTEEVLSGLAEPVQQFLLDTSILERFSGDLCDAVTGRTGSAALLEQLYSDNLFLIPLDDDLRWYRYHHLFADLLRSRQSTLQGERTAELHRRASRWFAQAGQESRAGERVILSAQAIQHALAAADYVSAVQLIEDHAAEIMDQWYLQAVREWLRSIPPEFGAQSPRTNLAFARLLLARGDFIQAAPYLERLEALFARPAAVEGSISSPALRAEWLALQATLLAIQGQPTKALALAQQARELAPDGELQTLSRVYLALATAYQQSGEPDRAVEAYRRLIDLGRSAADLMTELMGISALALLAIDRGQLHYGYDVAAQGVERVEQAGVLPPICAGLYGELGQVAFLWGQLEQAEQYFQRAAQASRLGGFSDADIFYAVARSRIQQMRGDLNAAGAEIQKAVQGMHADAPLVVREQVVAQQVNLYLARGDLAAARQALASAAGPTPAGEQLPVLEPGQELTYPQGVLHNAALRLQLYQARQAGRPDARAAGLDLAGRLLDACLHRQYIPLAIETFLLRARLHDLLGDSQAMQADLAAALDLAEPEGFLSVFLMEGRPVAEALVRLLENTEPGSSRGQFIQKILDTFAGLQGWSPPQPVKEPANLQPTGLYEALTGRELEVLYLMKEGQTYAEMAARLVVSINTVRTHVKSIYGKLGVNNRTAALEAARQMKLL